MLKIKMKRKQHELSASPTKFKRRSQSPIDFINSSEYRRKIKQNDFGMKFSFISQNKLHKKGVRNREHLLYQNSRITCTRDSMGDSEDSVSDNMEKIEATNINYQEKSFNQETQSTSFLKSLEECGNEFNNFDDFEMEEYEIAIQKIKQLEAEILEKNTRIQQQDFRLYSQEKLMRVFQLNQKKMKQALEKMEIGLAMANRKNCENQKKIKILMKKIKKRKNEDFFNLSPESSFEMDSTLMGSTRRVDSKGTRKDSTRKDSTLMDSPLLDPKETIINSKENLIGSTFLDSKETPLDPKGTLVNLKEAPQYPKETLLDSKKTPLDPKETLLYSKETPLDPKENLLYPKGTLMDSTQIVDPKGTLMDSTQIVDPKGTQTVDPKKTSTPNKK